MSSDDHYESSYDERAAADAHAQNLSQQISDTREALLRDSSTENVERLSDLLRQRFFALGNPKDIDEYFALEDTLPLVDPSAFAEPNVKGFNSELRTYEHKWVEWYPWLLSRGYALDARYNPSWVPSWQSSRRVRNRCADRYGAPLGHVMAATRVADGQRVWFKLCAADDANRPEGAVPDIEVAAHIFFSSEPQRSDPHNHCCPLLDIFRAPFVDGQQQYILVLPMLKNIIKPGPRTVGDLVECTMQLAEGLAFMHEHNFAHLDIHHRNTMMDASDIMPNGWHPWRSSYDLPADLEADMRPLPRRIARTPAGVRYFFVDFGISVQYGSQSERALVVGRVGLNRSAPEASKTVPYDPFPLDVRLFGDMVLGLHKRFGGLSFLRQTLERMTDPSPEARPSAAESLAMLRAAVSNRMPARMNAPLRDSSASLAEAAKVRLSYSFLLVKAVVSWRPQKSRKYHEEELEEEEEDGQSIELRTPKQFSSQGTSVPATATTMWSATEEGYPVYDMDKELPPLPPDARVTLDEDAMSAQEPHAL